MSNQKNNTPVSENPEKKMTRYDRKMQARREAEAREKRQRLISRICLIAVVALIAVLAVAIPVGKNISAKAEYIRIGDHSLNKIEYNFFSNYYTGYTKSMYQYFGMIDANTPLSEQKQSENTTWQQYFDRMTVDSLKECFALYDDAKNKGLTYDVSAEYNNFYTSAEASAKENSISLSKYLKNNFGSYATKAALKDALTIYLTSAAHYDYLISQNQPDAEAIAKEYVQNRTEYDTVSFYAMELAADIDEDASEDDIRTAMEAAKATLEQMKTEYTEGHAFEELYEKYNAAEDASDADSEANSETKNHVSFNENLSSGSVNTLYKDWLYDTERAEKDITIVEDTENNAFYIVAFVSRTKPEDTDETISSTLASEAVGAYIESLLENYPLNDSKDRLNLASMK